MKVDDARPGARFSRSPTIFWSERSSNSETPVALSFVIANADGTADLFIAPEKVTPELTAHLGNAVRVQPREAFVPALQALKGRKVAVDPERAVAAIFQALEGAGAQVVAVTDPVVLPKAIKNPVEQAGHRAAQARDGAAIARFLRWIEVEAPNGTVQLCQHHCPMQHVAEEFPEFCEAEQAAISRLLGSHTVRISTIASGAGICTTHVPGGHIA